MEANGFDRGRIIEAPRPAEVEAALIDYLLRIGGRRGERLLVPVGWNVGSFDMPFFRRTFPEAAKLFSRRSVDLNSVCFTFGSLLFGDPAARTWDAWKEQAKHFADRALYGVIPGGRHDAYYDAAAAVVEWMYLRNRLPLHFHIGYEVAVA